MTAAADSHGGERLAPVVPLFGGAVPDAPIAREDEGGLGGEDWHTTWRDSGYAGRYAAGSVSPAPDESDEPEGDDAQGSAEQAERRVARALAARGLSEREVRDRLRRDGVGPGEVEEIVDRLSRVGAIDDDRLAEQLVHQAVTRKNQGRRAVSLTLSKRGIAREAIDRALESLPDDDHERALEFARGKARSLARLDPDTALRRLVGQLARRGFGGSMAMTVARQALDEATGPVSRVRFE